MNCSQSFQTGNRIKLPPETQSKINWSKSDKLEPITSFTRENEWCILIVANLENIFLKSCRVYRSFFFNDWSTRWKNNPRTGRDETERGFLLGISKMEQRSSGWGCAIVNEIEWSVSYYSAIPFLSLCLMQFQSDVIDSFSTRTRNIGDGLAMGLPLHSSLILIFELNGATGTECYWCMRNWIGITLSLVSWASARVGNCLMALLRRLSELSVSLMPLKASSDKASRALRSKLSAVSDLSRSKTSSSSRLMSFCARSRNASDVSDVTAAGTSRSCVPLVVNLSADYSTALKMICFRCNFF